MGWTSVEPDLAPDPVLTAAFAGSVPGGRLAGPLLAFPTVDSTQTTCRRLAAEGAPEGTVVVADYQRAGRGQRDRRWTAPPRAGLLVSCLLRPPPPPSRWPELTVLAAAAVVEALARLVPIVARVRYPNDVVVGEQKLAGVLGESAVGPAPFIVLGIGINVGQRTAEWPEELRRRAVSLAELGQTVARETLLAAVLARLAAHYEAWLSGGTAAPRGSSRGEPSSLSMS